VSAPGPAEHRIARGALLQQVSQVWGTACMVLLITVLARRLPLAEFGVYGLFVSVSSYLLLVQLSIEGAAVRAIAGARAETDREKVFSTALALYAVGGLFAGLVIAGLGLLLAGVLGIPPSLRPSARAGVLILAAVTALGWPAKVFQDLLRGTQLFGIAALGEMAAYAAVTIGVVGLAFADAPLSLLIGVGGALSATIGIWCVVMARAFRVHIPFRRSAIDRVTAGDLLRVSGYLLIVGLADLVVYSLDRVILAGFQGLRAVGLYEGAVRPQNMMRQLQGTLVLTVAPVASSLRGADDARRNQQLLVRGTRYVLAIVAPVATVLAILAAPLLGVWLGRRYEAAGDALSILAAYWLVGGATGVATAMLVAAGRVRVLAIYSWVYAGLNLILALSLTPGLGLEGVAIGISVPGVLLSPWIIGVGLREFQVGLSDLARAAWLPAYATSAALAGVLFVARSALDLHSLVPLAIVAGGGLTSAFLAYWLVWFDSPERELVKALFRRRAAV
jgi:O-antigen/teichoic acid export membrane protein